MKIDMKSGMKNKLGLIALGHLEEPVFPSWYHPIMNFEMF